MSAPRASGRSLVDHHGRTVASGVSPIETAYPRPTWAEQDPGTWWSAARSAVRSARQAAGVGPDEIAAIGLDCTACTVVACDDDGKPLCPALLWMDQRAFREADDISATGDPVLRYVSGRVSPEWMLPKALWLKRNKPDLYRSAARVVEGTDWMMHRLTGELDLVAQPRRGQVELRAAGRRLAGRPACSRSGSRTFSRNGHRASFPSAGAMAGSAGPRPRSSAWPWTSRSPRAGSTPIWGCSAWARPRTATWR